MEDKYQDNLIIEYDAKKIELLNTIFSPSAPIRKRDLFFGRLEQILNTSNTINENGQHAVLYGERGVGKTSLANIIGDFFPDVFTVKITCNRSENFKSVWNKALRKVKFTNQKKSLGFKAENTSEIIQLDLFLPNKEDLDSTDIENILENLDNKLLFIFDEFDSVTDSNTKMRMADTIKTLSDNCPNVTILIVGIADNVSELIGEHLSLQRCLRQIKVQRMSAEDQKDLVVKNYIKLGLKIDEIVLKNIIDFSVGFPHFTHLLAKYSAEVAIHSGKNIVDNLCFNNAAIIGIDNTNESLRTDFQKATISSKTKNKFENTVYAASQCEVDEFDCFTANELITPFQKLTKSKITRQNLTYCLGELCEGSRGKILEKVGQSKNIKYRFKNPMMKAFVKLKLFNQLN